MYIWYVFPMAVCCFELFITVITGEALFSMYLLMSCQTSLGGECLSTSVAYRSSHWSWLVERWNITDCTSSYPNDIIKCDKVCLCVCLVWVSVTSLTMVTNTWAASIVLLYRRQKVDNPKISYNSNQVYRVDLATLLLHHFSLSIDLLIEFSHGIPLCSNCNHWI